MHCAAGKDRTGVVVALALAVAGVAHDDIVADYALTAEVIDAIVAKLAACPTYAEDMEKRDVASHTPRAETMDRVLALLDARWGGPVGWLTAHGFGPAEQAALRAPPARLTRLSRPAARAGRHAACAGTCPRRPRAAGSSTVPPGPPCTAVPTLVAMATGTPSTRNGSVKQAAPARRGVAASPGPGRPGSRMANSSPLSRPTRVAGAHGRRQPGGHLAQQLVAGGVADRVVHRLEAVEVAEQDAGEVAGRQAASASCSRSTNSVRFGSPVSASCVAWCRTVSSSCAFCSAVAPGRRPRAAGTARRRPVRWAPPPGRPPEATPRKVLPAMQRNGRPRPRRRSPSSSARSAGLHDSRCRMRGCAVAEHPDQLGGVLGAQHGRHEHRVSAASMPTEARVRRKPSAGSQSIMLARLQPTMSGSASVDDRAHRRRIGRHRPVRGPAPAGRRRGRPPGGRPPGP